VLGGEDAGLRNVQKFTNTEALAAFHDALAIETRCLKARAALIGGRNFKQYLHGAGVGHDVLKRLHVHPLCCPDASLAFIGNAKFWDVTVWLPPFLNRCVFVASLIYF